MLDNKWRLLESDGAAAFDAIFPPLLKLLCTWDTDIQIHAASVYTSILDRTKELAIRIKKREEEDVFMYDPAELPPQPWMIDLERIEKWLVPTILLMADTEGSRERLHTAVFRARYEQGKLVDVERIFRSQDVAAVINTGRMLLLPDKTLLIALTEPRTLPRPDLPQRLDSDVGKILRINRDRFPSEQSGK